MKTYITILCICFGLVGCGCENTPDIKNTKNVQSKWNIQFYNNKYSLIKKAEAGLFFGSTENQKQLLLKIGESIEYPDHHSSRKVTLVNTDDKGAYFKYESSFNHMSFGKNLIENDVGEFFLKWKYQ